MTKTPYIKKYELHFKEEMQIIHALKSRITLLHERIEALKIDDLDIKTEVQELLLCSNLLSRFED